MYDVIIVGARCAGSPTAMLLARKGCRVLLVDKATFPSDTMSTHQITPLGIARLKRWGLLDKIVASNCPPLSKFTFDFGPVALIGWPPPAHGITESYAPRRRVLDKILVDAALESGVELREGFCVQEILRDGERVTGIRGRTPGGAPIAEHARLVIGADGRRSLVARTVHAPSYHTKPSLTCCYYTYWSGLPMEGTEGYLRDRCALVAFPTNDHLTCLLAEWPHREFPTIRADIKGNFLKKVALISALAERLHNGRQEEPFVGTADLPNFFRKPYGPGWVLVGDAGYHRDPACAQGITDAFGSAELVAEAIDAGFSGRRPLEEALATYEQQRNEAVMPMYELILQLASLEPPTSEMQQLLSALHGNQTETNRFIGTMVGTVSIPAFFSPENIQRIVAESKQAAL